MRRRTMPASARKPVPIRAIVAGSGMRRSASPVEVQPALAQWMEIAWKVLYPAGGVNVPPVNGKLNGEVVNVCRGMIGVAPQRAIADAKEIADAQVVPLGPKPAW